MQSPKESLWIGPFPRLYVTKTPDVYASTLEVGSLHFSGYPTYQALEAKRDKFEFVMLRVDDESAMPDSRLLARGDLGWVGQSKWWAHCGAHE